MCFEKVSEQKRSCKKFVPFKKVLNVFKKTFRFLISELEKPSLKERRSRKKN
jgi:hypothetical protein